jgi:hypothetical protein
VVGEKVQEIVARSDNEVWILFSHKGGLWQYQLDSGKWKEYFMINDFENIIPVIRSSPNLSAYNELWAVGYVKKESTGQTEVPPSLYFSKYNEKSDRFEFVQSDSDFLTNYNVGYVVEQDQRGSFWITAQRKNDKYPNSLIGGEPFTLFKFDPSTGQVDAYGEYPFPGYFKLDPSGNIWMLTTGEKPHLQEFIPATNETRSYENIPPLISGIDKNGGGIYFDRLGYLWINDLGWVDFSDPSQPAWFQLIRPPEFLTDRAEGEVRMTIWGSYRQIYQSSDGTYWFGSQYGLVKLNPQTGEWCKFTNGTSPFAEDGKQNRHWCMNN